MKMAAVVERRTLKRVKVVLGMIRIAMIAMLYRIQSGLRFVIKKMPIAMA